MKSNCWIQRALITWVWLLASATSYSFWNPGSHDARAATAKTTSAVSCRLRLASHTERTNPSRCSTNCQNDEPQLLYYGYRYLNASTGRWLSRDPINEESGGNLYAFVANDPNALVDPLGEDFIVVGGLRVPTIPILGVGMHMSLAYYKAQCSFDPHEGIRFSPGSPPDGAALTDAVELWTAWHTYKHRFYSRPKPTEPPEQHFIFVPISYIKRQADADRMYVLYSDADNGRGNSEQGWKKIINAALIYSFAEQTDGGGNPPRILNHWPNSRYQLLGNNSNTFVRQMAKLIGRDPDVIGGGWIAGRHEPEPVSNPGWTPEYSPW